jgi:Skp family chaperone for outer membrane proteins
MGNLDWLRQLTKPQQEGITMKITKLLMLSIATTMSAMNLMAATGVVDMEKLIKLHPRTGSDRAILQQYVSDFQDERKSIMERLEKATAEFEQLRKAAEDVSLSEKAIEEKRTLAKAKIQEIKQLERKARELASERQKHLTSEELRMRQRVVSDIREIVAKVAKKKNLDIVLDNTGMGIGGYNAVVYNDEKLDITDDVIKAMPKSDK